MPSSSDIILVYKANLAVHITYDRQTIISDVDTVDCLDQARNSIPPGAKATYPIPGPQIYRSGDVVLSIQPNSSPVMLWNEWNTTVRALQWFREEYVALTMVFSVTNWFGEGVLGTGALTVT